MEILSQTPQDTINLAQSIAEKLKPGDIIALSGDLGSGKTFFTSALSRALEIKKRVQSPTFVLVREYSDQWSDKPIKKIYHVDLYRLEDQVEAIDIGLESFFTDKNAITIIEWPELAKEFLPEKTIHIKFEVTGENSRKIYVQNLS